MKNFLAKFIILMSNILFGQNQFIDLNFGANNGYSILNFDENFLTPDNIINDNNNLIITASDFNKNSYLFKLDNNGIIDYNFGENGHIIFDDDNPFQLLSYNTGLSKSIDESYLIVNEAYPHNFQSDGRVLITKINTNGNLDSEYGENGQFISDLPMGIIPLGIKNFENNSILIAGYNQLTNEDYPSQKIILTKINEFGILDTTFGSNGAFELNFDYLNYQPKNASIQDESIFILFQNILTTEEHFVVKFDLNTMNYDPNFGNNGVLVINNFNSFEHIDYLYGDQPNEFYLTGYGLVTEEGVFDVFVYKYINNQLDQTFGENGIVKINLLPNSNSDNQTLSIKRHENKLLIMGRLLSFDPSNEKAYFIQLNMDGNVDNEFGINGIYINYLFKHNQFPYDYVYNEDSIIVYGSWDSGNQANLVIYKFFKKIPDLETIDSSDLEFIIYPNPVKDFLHLKNSDKILNIEMFDLNGIPINNIIIYKDKIDMSNLSKGVYFIKINTFKNSNTFKLIKN